MEEALPWNNIFDQVNTNRQRYNGTPQPFKASGLDLQTMEADLDCRLLLGRCTTRLTVLSLI